MKPSRSVSCQSCSALHDNGTKICSHCYSRVRPWGRPKGTTRKAGYKIGDNGLRKGPTRKAGYKVGGTGGRKGATREAGYEVGGAAVPQGQKRKLTVMADETQGSVPGTMLTPSTVSPPVTNPPLPAQVSTAQPIIAPPLSRMVPPPSSSIIATIDQLTTLRSALVKQQWIQEQIDQPKMPASTYVCVRQHVYLIVCICLCVPDGGNYLHQTVLVSFMHIVYQCFPQSSNHRGGKRVEKATTSKGLMHSSYHIKENKAMVGAWGEGEHPWGNHCIYCVDVECS